MEEIDLRNNVRMGNYTEVNRLLKIGVDPNLGDNWTHIIMNGDTFIAWLFLNHDADVDRKRLDGKTPLTLAALWGNRDIAELLLRWGAEIDMQDEYGNTALICAAVMGYVDIVNLLLIWGAEVDIQNSYGYTALMVASVIGNKSSTDLLLRWGADTEMRDIEGYTAASLTLKRGGLLMLLGSNRALDFLHIGLKIWRQKKWIG